jgi:HD-GYP domain-containing protein (c-di-GMP phosphodiesterase class II)
VPYQRLENLDELRIGLYVKLDCSWWAHPFANSRFKIVSKKDIEIIRGIRKLKLYYDAELSDPLPSEQPETEEIEDTELAEVDQANSAEDFLEEDTFFTIQDEEQGIEETIPFIQEPDPEEIKKNRKRLYQDRKTHLKKVEDAYWKVLGKSKDIFKRIGTGHHAAVKNAAQLVTNVGAVIQHEQATMTLMDIVSSTGMAEGLSSHALNVCIMSSIIGKEMGLSPDELHMLGLGALFHDMGKRLLPMKVNFHSTGITMIPDPASSKLHPEKGKELMGKFKDFPLPSLEIIIQHHERLDGSGYPNGLTKDQISLMAQIVMVADEYDELCNSAEIEKSLTPHEALSQLYKHVDSQKHKFSKEVILTLIQTMTVFPPGTMVELSDGTIGQVVSVSLNNPTKPLLLSSHFAGTRQEAIMVDLSEELNLSITRSLKPGEVPPKILEFLSPRRASLFVHPAEKTSSLTSAMTK